MSRISKDLVDIVPEPAQIEYLDGTLHIPAKDVAIGVSYSKTNGAASLIAKRFSGKLIHREKQAGTSITLALDGVEGLPENLRPEQQLESYLLKISHNGIFLSAFTSEGLLRGAATLFQITRPDSHGDFVLPCLLIRDWPMFRDRGAAHWLLNVEANRWIYDRGDGPEAFLNRIRRKLDFCFDHKINMVWFDGFGWDAEKFPGYESLMRECNRFARERGIGLIFGGYGGGYGNAYQTGVLYQCGFSGKTYFNRRPWPNGKKYACRGWSNPKYSRFYGTCLSNEDLAQAKIEEMQQFIKAVNPGYMYIHDIDDGSWLRASMSWKKRCAECRRRWPNDDISAPDGMAAAFASWFLKMRQAFNSLSYSNGYTPARDLTLMLVSPLYTHCNETAPDNVWDFEMRYFETLSQMIGPISGIRFCLREQFYDQTGKKKVAELRRKLDKIGNGHGIHIISFVGGDNYRNDDPVNISGVITGCYEGAESVSCVNTGTLPEPIHVLNAEFLWRGSAGGYRENPKDKDTADALLEKIISGTYHPPELFAPGGRIQQICIRLWGEKAGSLIYQALLTSYEGFPPVSHIWWSVTKIVNIIEKGQPVSFKNLKTVWTCRGRATSQAIGYVRQAKEFSTDEDIHWFAACLEVGERFARVLSLLADLKIGDNQEVSSAQIENTLTELESYIHEHFSMKFTDVLGGDIGCWLGTVAALRRLFMSFVRRKQERITGDFIVDWYISRPIPLNENRDLTLPQDRSFLEFQPRKFSDAFCNVYQEFMKHKEIDTIIYFLSLLECEEPMQVELLLGYDGPVLVWIDGEKIFQDPKGKNPAKADMVSIPWSARKGKHELIVALCSAQGKAGGIFARFRRKDSSPAAKKIKSLEWVILPKSIPLTYEKKNYD